MIVLCFNLNFMAFDFIKNRPKKEYKNTFLQNIFLSIHFDKIDRNNISSDFAEKWKNYIKTTFNDLDVSSSFWETPISISRDDGCLTIILSNGFIGAIVGAKDYRSFIDNILPQLYKLKTFLKDVLNLDSINSISVRKVNIWQFKSKDNIKIEPLDVRKKIFSNDLICKKSNGILDENENKIPNMHKYEWFENDIKVIARTVFLRYSNKNTAFNQVLDTEAIYAKNNIAIEDLEEKSILLNNILYELYHWCINTQILKIMEGDK